MLALVALAIMPARASATCTPGPADPSITVCSPANGSTVSSPVHVTAAVRSSITVSKMWIYLDYNSTPLGPYPGTSLDTNITVPTGSHVIRVKAWNSAGTRIETDVNITVTAASGPVASVSPSSLNFGTVPVGSNSSPQYVTLQNTGNATLNLTSIAVSGDYMQSNVCGSSLAPGASCNISITFRPTASGTRSGTLSITDNAPGSPQTVSLTGTGGSSGSCPPGTADPSIHVCSPTNGSTVTSPVHVVAVVHSSQTVSKMWIYLDNNSTPFGPYPGTSLDTNITVPTGSHVIRVKAWTSSGTRIETDVTITVSSGGGSGASLSPTTLNFGNVTVGQTGGPQTVTLTNNSSSTLSITSIAASGDYSQSNSCGSSLGAGANCAIHVSFTPTATGTRNGTLTVTDNASNSPQTASLTGVGQNAGGSNIPINHFIFMLQENRSFDQYFSNLNNYRTARGYPANVDVASPTATQPQDNGNYISRFHMRTMCIEELSPNWLESHGDANRWNPSSDNILMDGFVHTAQGFAHYAGLTDTGGYRAMGYYTEADLPYYYFMATQFATSDRWFSPVPTNSTVNRVYGFAATSAGHVHDGSWTISNRTIFQALAESGHTWKIYYTDTDSSGKAASRIWRFQPFANNNQSHIVPISQYFTDVQNGTLPDFAFIETGFLSGRDEHPGGTIAGNPNSGNHVQRGAAYVASIINALMQSQSWTDSAFILSWDEVGGPYDHVPPDMNVPNPDGIPPNDLYAGDPTGDFTRTGFRVPLIVVSPWTRPHYVSHTSMDFTAVLKLVETRFGISPLTGRDAAMPDMTEFFDFVNKPWATPPTPPSQPTNGECNYTDLP